MNKFQTEKIELFQNNNKNNQIIQDINNNPNSINENNSLSFQEIVILNKKSQSIENSFISENINIVSYKNDESPNLGNENIIYNGKNHGNIGKNIVLFNKYVLGPKNHLWILISIIISISISWYFWIYAMGNFYPKIIYIIMHILFSLTLFFMIISYLIEPGIIPKNCPDFVKINVEENSNENKKKLVIPRIFTERKCNTCKIIRPSGASHCRICDNCVMGFDHHCVFISNCVGKRNHKYFFLFLLFGSIFSILSILFNLIVIIYVFIIKGSETISYIYKGNK